MRQLFDNTAAAAAAASCWEALAERQCPAAAAAAAIVAVLRIYGSGYAGYYSIMTSTDAVINYSIFWEAAPRTDTKSNTHGERLLGAGSSGRFYRVRSKKKPPARVQNVFPEACPKPTCPVQEWWDYQVRCMCLKKGGDDVQTPNAAPPSKPADSKRGIQSEPAIYRMMPGCGMPHSWSADSANHEMEHAQDIQAVHEAWAALQPKIDWSRRPPRRTRHLQQHHADDGWQFDGFQHAYNRWREGMWTRRDWWTRCSSPSE